MVDCQYYIVVCYLGMVGILHLEHGNGNIESVATSLEDLLLVPSEARDGVVTTIITLGDRIVGDWGGQHRSREESSNTRQGEFHLEPEDGNVNERSKECEN